MPAPLPPNARKLRPRLRAWLYGVAGVAVFLMVGYCIVGSAAFFKSVVLPRLSRAIGAQVTVDYASISPFSHVELRQVKIAAPGSEPVFQAANVRMEYSLWSIIGGTVKVNHLTVDSPSLELVVHADGTRNIDALLKSSGPPATGTAASARRSRSPRLELRNMAFKDATLRYLRNLPGGGVQSVEVSGLNAALDQLINGQSGQFTATATCRAFAPSNSLLEANCSGEIQFTVNQDLIPTSLKANFNHEMTKAAGTFLPMAGIRSAFRVEMTPTELREASERLSRDNQVLGQATLAGPLDLAKKEGRLVLTLGPIDRPLFSLIGATMGIDFGSASLKSVSTITIKDGGTLVALTTQWAANHFSINSNGHPTPSVDLTADCAAVFNLKNQFAQFQTVTLEGQAEQSPFLHGSMTEPMTVSWGAQAAPATDSAFELTLPALRLSQWQSLIGNALPAGTLSLNLKVHSHNGGKQLDSHLTARLADLETNALPGGISEGVAVLDVESSNLTKFTLTNGALTLTAQDHPVLRVVASGDYEHAVFTLRSQMEVVCARLLGKGSLTPFKLGAALSGTFATPLLNLTQIEISLPPTDRVSDNQLRLSGKLDFSRPALTVGQFDLTANTLDVAPFYDALTAPATPTAQSSPPASDQTAGATEPKPVRFPVQINVSANVKEVLLRDLSVQDCQLAGKLDGSAMLLGPCSLSLNGGAVHASVDLDLGRKGYRYSLALAADKVPLEPIADFLSPETAGKYKGFLIINTKVNGAGLTGPSLQKNLAGQFLLTLTNGDFAMTGPRLQQIATPVAELLGLHEALSWPLSWVDAQFDLGAGKLQITRCVAGSSAFEASLAGTIPIAENWADSPLDLPVLLSLRHSLAENIGLAPPDTASDLAYVPIRNFVTVKGTLGQPASDLNKRALGGVVLNSGEGLARRAGGEAKTEAKSVWSGLRRFFHRSADESSPSTNAPDAATPSGSSK